MGLSEDLVHFIPHMLAPRWLQIPHRRFHVGVTKPLLNCAQIDTSPKGPRSERRPELVEPKVVFIQLRALGHSFQTVEKIELWIAAGSREN
jgi:hypothetical protein